MSGVTAKRYENNPMDEIRVSIIKYDLRVKFKDNYEQVLINN